MRGDSEPPLILDEIEQRVRGVATVLGMSDPEPLPPRLLAPMGVGGEEPALEARPPLELVHAVRIARW
jgi:hypothetical protein